MTKDFEFCSLCKRNHDQGRQHVYKPGHKKRLEEVLGKALKRVNEVRFFLNNIIPLKEGDRSSNRHWCTFCKFEVPEDASFLVCENTLHHLASDAHAEKLRDFWVEHGAAYSKRHLFAISRDDLAKWEKAAIASKSNKHLRAARPAATNIQPTVSGNPVSLGVDGCNSLLVAGTPSNTSSAQHTMSLNGFPSLSSKATRQQEPSVASPADGSLPRAASPADLARVVSDTRLETPNNLAGGLETSFNALPRRSEGQTPVTVQEVSREHPLPLRSGDNMHTGGCPPWLRCEDIANHVTTTPVQLTAVGGTKGKKLNPNRVGAAWADRRRRELEEEKAGLRACTKPEASWRPNFGGVWDGRRKEHHESSKRQRINRSDKSAGNPMQKSFPPLAKANHMLTDSVMPATGEDEQ